MRRFVPLVALASLAVGPTVAHAQDVELLARHYGTPIPEGYYRTLAAHPDAFRFQRGRATRLRLQLPVARQIAGVTGGPAATLGAREGPVVGTFRIPVVLGLFSDTPTPPPFGPDTVETAYFGSGPGTVTAYYGEVSGGKVTLTGDVMGWVRSDVSQAQATGTQSGLEVNTAGTFIVNVLSKIQGVDWGQYDNDGPDGIPNSGDDDGYVDALAVLHPTSGAECGGANTSDRIWSHKWNLAQAAGHVFTTTTPSANGGFIKIDDYFIQPIYACNGRGLNPIGVFTHETGHAFGLPDLYDTGQDGSGQGDGDWDLMATGAWGCDDTTPSRPCHMGAWSKAMLGWVDVKPLPGGVDLGTLRLPPVESSHEVYRVDAGDGSGDYFLLENRQRLGFDGRIPGEGLLIWQIDPGWVSSHWATNNINAYSHLGVWVREADGNADLTTSGGNRGDAGDPFPYVSGTSVNQVFHATSNPASISHLGTPTGVTLLDIVHVASDVQFRLLTRFTSISVRSEGDNGSGGLLTVNGSPVTSADETFMAAPFVIQKLEAAGGEPISPGVREPFVDWKDDPGAPRIRALPTPLVDSTFVAQYAGRQVHLAIDATGGVNGVSPGSFTSNPPSEDLWFAPGTDVQVEAVASQGFSFVNWTGALAGQGNPAQISVAAPTDAGAVFRIIYAVPTKTYAFVAGEAPDSVQLKVENGTDPVTWTVVSGSLPEGLVLRTGGTFSGSALDLGTFPLTMRAVDARGLSAQGSVTLTVSKPAFSVDRIAAPFLQNGQTLTLMEEAFLDHQGNQNGAYDLGDLRSWVLANPDMPVGTQAAAKVRPGGVRADGDGGAE